MFPTVSHSWISCGTVLGGIASTGSKATSVSEALRAEGTIGGFRGLANALGRGLVDLAVVHEGLEVLGRGIVKVDAGAGGFVPHRRSAKSARCLPGWQPRWEARIVEALTMRPTILAVARSRCSRRSLAVRRCRWCEALTAAEVSMEASMAAEVFGRRFTKTS